MKFKIGDMVKVREDLLSGKRYFNEDKKVSDVFTFDMKKFMGKITRIGGFSEDKYHLDGIALYTFTDGMLIAVNGSNNKEIDDVKRINEYSKEVERLLNHMLKLVPEQLVNNALDRNDKKSFIEITEKYYKSNK